MSVCVFVCVCVRVCAEVCERERDTETEKQRSNVIFQLLLQAYLPIFFIVATYKHHTYGTKVSCHREYNSLLEFTL